MTSRHPLSVSFICYLENLFICCSPSELGHKFMRNLFVLHVIWPSTKISYLIRSVFPPLPLLAIHCCCCSHKIHILMDFTAARAVPCRTVPCHTAPSYVNVYLLIAFCLRLFVVIIVLSIFNMQRVEHKS